MVTSGSVLYGNELIPYEIHVRPARKTLGIEVHPDGRVLVLAPSLCDDATIEDKVRLRVGWISRQLTTFSRYERHTAPRQYLSGESHRYLGRQYRLKVVINDQSTDKAQINLTRGEIVVTGTKKLPQEKLKELLRCWYLSRAREVFDDVLTDTFDVFCRRRLAKPRVSVRDMRSRWGSLSPGGLMTLNSRLIQAPRPCIEYVILHELCHLVHRDHNAKFFALLGQLMPDWQKRKQRLEKALL
jgi:predicted metal-dependent hydrolase